MLNTRLVREQDALLQFEVMAWMIRQYGSPERAAVPSPLHKSPDLEHLVHDGDDQRSVEDWAEDCLGMIKSGCHMDDWDVTLIPVGGETDPDMLPATRTLMDGEIAREPYVVDIHGRPVLFYNPANCVDPGHFTARAVLRLAELRVSGFEPDMLLPPLMNRMVTLTAAAYSRQGFTLANLPEEVSDYLTGDEDTRAVPERVVVNNLCFSTCLALRVRRQSAEQIVATYGTRMSKTFRRKVRQACRQIDSFDQELKLLQVLAEPAPRRAAATAAILARTQFA